MPKAVDPPVGKEAAFLRAAGDREAALTSGEREW